MITLRDDRTAITAGLAEKQLRRLCRAAWRQGFLAGFNGNASLLCADRPGYCLVTRAGSPKGGLSRADLCLVRLEDGFFQPETGRSGPSSELGMHLAIYGGTAARAILHSHPPALLAMEIAGGRLEDLPLFEAASWSRRLARVPRLEPGTAGLAAACGKAAAGLCACAAPDAGGALWLGGHGLCAFGPDAGWTLALTEQLEHLARIWLDAKKICLGA